MFSKLWRAIKAIFKKIVSFIKDFIKKFGVIILAVIAVWFAPAIGAWLASAGAPGWLSSVFAWVGSTLTPGLQAIGGWLGSGVSSLWGGAKTGWAALSFGQKATMLLGAATLLAPEETAAFVEEVITTVSDAVVSVGSNVLEAVATSPLGMIVIGGLLLWLLASSKDKDEQPTQEVQYG